MLRKIFIFLLFRIKSLFIKRPGEKNPFVSELLNKVFVYKDDENLKRVKIWRKKILSDKTELSGNTLGAGTRNGNKKGINTGRIAAISGLPHKYGILLYKLVDKFKPATILELGTGLGLSTAYLAIARPESNVITIEGVSEKTKFAQSFIKKLNLKNIHFLEGRFDELLPRLLSDCMHPLMIFIDGDHTFNSTVRYFNLISIYAEERTIIIFDDIHWSEEMEKAWKFIIENKKVSLSIDLFRCGIVFFSKKVDKQHLLINF